MMKKKLSIFFAIILLSRLTFAEEVQLPEINLSEHDRILIISPHPDDEIISTAGVIQQAVHLKIPLKIVYLTNGDSNELAFIFYKKRPVLSRGALLLGQERMKESEDATVILGVKPDERVFLGYPDFGLLKMFTHYWKPNPPMKSMLTRAIKVPYKESPSFDKLHIAENLLDDLKRIIKDIQPTKIFISHPADLNSDHQAAYLFLKLALWELDEELIYVPQILSYISHYKKWPHPKHFAPNEIILPPKTFAQDEVYYWNNFFLSAKQIQRKEASVEFFKTQKSYRPYFLKSFVRRNELFSINLDRSPDASLAEYLLEPIKYALTKDNFQIQFRWPDWFQRRYPLNIFILGYKNEKPFGQMPKIVIKLSKDGQSIYDAYEPLLKGGIKVIFGKNTISILCPLALLENPEKVITSIKASINPWPSNLGQWKILTLK